MPNDNSPTLYAKEASKAGLNTLSFLILFGGVHDFIADECKVVPDWT